jgi:hypothetical protein
MAANLRFYLLTLLVASAFWCVFKMPGGMDRINGYWMASNYPPAIPALLEAVKPVLGEKDGILALLLIFAVLAPALIVERFWGQEMGVAYLLASGGMVMLIDTVSIAQAATQVLMLLSLTNPLFYFVFGALGPFVHREWLGGFVATFLFDIARRGKSGIVALV